jgi:hypothetical protein
LRALHNGLGGVKATHRRYNLSVAREKKSAYVDCTTLVDRIGFGRERIGRLIPFRRALRLAAADLDPTLEPRHLDGL